jgi:PAS domain S-box-containing protein
MSQNLATDWTLDQLSRKLEEKQSIVNGISDALMLLDVDSYKIIDVNQAFLSFYRVSRDEVIGRTCHEITHRLPHPCSQLDARDPCPLEKSVSAGELFHVEHVHKDSNGNDLYLEITSYPIKDADGAVTRIIHLSRDVTSRKMAEEALKESSEKIKQFAYSVAHDLKSPAVGIRGLTRRLHQNYGGVLDERGKNYCEQILKASEQIVAFVDKINAFIATKEVPLRIEQFPLQETLKAIREEFSEQLQFRGIRWSEPDYIPEIKADKLSMVRLLRNLVDNALKHGGDALSEIRIGYEESRKFHILSVTDNGVGVRTEDFDRLWNPFERKKGCHGIAGVGLGLAIVKDIAEQHQGKVWTVPGKESGTTFYVALSKDLQPAES